MNMLCKVLLILIVSVVCVKSWEGDTLELVHVFFRHGARTPELKDVYPNDPYKEEDFLPMGWGQLTNYGKQMSFKLGQLLNNRYKHFFGEIYTSELIHAQSTDTDRTKMTALLVLAGMFPPSKSQTWNEDFPWLPIPLAYEKEPDDHFLQRPDKHCPLYIKLLKEAASSEEILSQLAAKQDILNYLTKNTGKEISTFEHVFGLYQTLTAETFMNYTLPEWTKSVYPRVITDLAIRQCELETSTKELNKLFGGRILQTVIEQMVAKTTNSLKPHGRKIFLYSGHEHTVFSSLAALDLFDHHFPSYASATMYELHNMGNSKYAVKILYQKSLDQDPEVKQLKDCDILCPLHKFIEIIKPVIPKNYTEECQSPVFLD